MIKYFRAIHFVLLFLLVLFSYKGRSILQFFNGYVKNNYNTSVVTNLHNMYAPMSLVLIVLLIVITSGAFMVLMIRKKKPYKLYFFATLYYVIVFLSLFYIRGVLASFSENLLEATSARSLRDLIFLASIPQFAIIFSVFIRAVGFDLKKFNFASDLREMNYSSQDAEEFEVNVNLDVYKAEQKLRRLFRELIYYAKENKYVVIFVGIVFLVIAFNFVRNNIHGNYDVSYGMNKTFKYEKLDITFLEAYISNIDYHGETVDDKYFLTIKMNVRNESGLSVKIDYNNFKLDLGGRSVLPTPKESLHFIDIASGTVPMNFSHRSNMTFMLTYELSARDVGKINKIVIHNGVVYDKGKAIDKHIYVRLKTKKIKNVEKVDDYSLNETVKFDQTFLNNTTLKLTTQELYKRYIYKYSDCISADNCSLFDDMLTVQFGGSNNIILVFESEYNQDLNTGYSQNYTTLSSFVDNFCTIQYRISNEIYTEAKNITPINVNNFIAFEVPQNIEYADLIQLIVTIRNKQYYININK